MNRPVNLLLCFDAFGTLFRPKRTVAIQYADVARQCGLSNFSDDDLQSSFKNAIKREAQLNPNYGKATGLGATQWWTNVINNTFAPLLSQGQPMPENLTSQLLHRFSSREGYNAEPNIVNSFAKLKQGHSRHFSNIVTGVITNSDNRVPDVLSSLGLRVSPLRYGTHQNVSGFWDGGKPSDYDIDFHCMSYDVGLEKPDPRIFDAAESMLEHVLTARHTTDEAISPQDRNPQGWLKVYVGDEYSKDVEGSTMAGWRAILLDPGNGSPQIPTLEHNRDSTLGTVFRKNSVLRVDSIEYLANWLAT